ncbi:MAG: aldo/keto reductase [Lachnospiraceae bacterium]|nr:aldo/keto reductase [Lachnospiraceae bacterium]
MIYRDFQGMKLSMLGFGAMRLPVHDDNDSDIDRELTFRMVDDAMKSGINYYDTAWGYHNGNSEIVLGEALARYPRDSFYLASKFPGYDLSNMTKVREIFEQQLKKTRTDYFDFYLFHNVCEMNIEQYLDPKFGIYDYLIEQKKNGRIRHLGFSGHGEIDVLKRFLDAYGESMEFGQLQLNYLDWKFQHGKEKVDLLNERGIPVWVMEPVRGGKLAHLPGKMEEKLGTLRPDEDIPAWAFRFLQSVPSVTVVLSGMSDADQLAANIRTFEEEKPLTDPEMEALMGIVDEMMSGRSVPCTACHYCTSHCPQQIDIPRMIELYNEHLLTTEDGGFGFIAPMALSAIPADRQPAACLHCRSCEKVCPQQIKISEVMTDFVQKIG